MDLAIWYSELHHHLKNIKREKESRRTLDSSFSRTNTPPLSSRCEYVTGCVPRWPLLVGEYLGIVPGGGSVYAEQGMRTTFCSSGVTLGDADLRGEELRRDGTVPGGGESQKWFTIILGVFAMISSCGSDSSIESCFMLGLSSAVIMSSGWWLAGRIDT